MTGYREWSDVRTTVVAETGGEEEVARDRKRNQAYIDGHRPADRRAALARPSRPSGWA